MNSPAPQPEQEPDECDAPTSGQIYVGLGWTKDIIVMRTQDVTADSKAMFAAIKVMVAAFANQNMVGVKLASEALVEASASLQATARKINDDASVLARKAREHINRRPRA